ncbi:MAG: ribosome maturation factor RimP [Bacteroidota bacterium]
MDLKGKIETLVEENLTDQSHFLVDVVISANKGPRRVLILIDGDQGITIDDCAVLSRKVGFQLEEDEAIDDKYTLEVSSPGVDFPLGLQRQYKRNIGRSLKITTAENNELLGNLLAVSDQFITLDREVKKGKKKEYEKVEIPFSEINKAIVQVSFK